MHEVVGILRCCMDRHGRRRRKRRKTGWSAVGLRKNFKLGRTERKTVKLPARRLTLVRQTCSNIKPPPTTHTNRPISVWSCV